MAREEPPIDELAELILDSFRRGGLDAVSQLSKRHPEHSERIGSLLTDMLALAASSDSGSEVVSPHASVPGVIGEYRILREIGRGGMGIVFEAEQLDLDRRVALKVLPRHTLMDERQLERFRREARAAGKLRHDGIVPVFGAGCHEGLHYYVMQLVEGRGLDRVVRSLRDYRDWEVQGEDELVSVKEFLGVEPLSGSGSSPARAPVELPEPEPPFAGDRVGAFHADVVRSACVIAARVARALVHAHEQGVLHRDVKPSNILLDRNCRVWLTDFGLAKADDAHELTESGEVVGTLRYMAPERFAGWSDERCDVYAVGLVLYELLVFEPAFDAIGRDPLTRQIVSGDVVPPGRRDRRIPRDVNTIVMKALEVDPECRYRTAEALARDLELFLDGRPIEARPSSWFERRVKSARRHPVVAALAAVVLLATIGLGVFALYVLDKQEAISAGEEVLRSERFEERLAQAFHEMSHGSPSRAREEFVAIISGHGALPEAVGGAALACLHDDQPEEALVVLDAHTAARDASPGLTWLRRHIATGEVDMPLSAQAAGALDHFLVGAAHMHAGHAGDAAAYGRALASYRRAMQQGRRARPLYAIEAAHAAIHLDDAEARAVLGRQLADWWPESAAALYWAGFALISVESERALDLLRRSLDRDDSNARTWSGLASVLEVMGRTEEARDAIRRALELREDIAAMWSQRARLDKELGRTDRAEEALSIALEREPEFDAVRFDLIRMKLSRRELDAARRLARPFVERGSRNDASLVNLGADFFGVRDEESAEALLRKAVEQHPSNPKGFFNLAFLLLRRGEADAAVELLAGAVRADPSYRRAHVLLGRVHLNEGRPAEAVTAYRRALDLDGEDGGVTMALARALRFAGDYETALETARRGRDLGAPGPDAKTPFEDWETETETLADQARLLLRLRVEGWEGVDPPELAQLAAVALVQGRYHLAARLFEAALAADGTLAQESGRHRLAAGVAAARSARGDCDESAHLEIATRARWSSKALDWLESELESVLAEIDERPELEARFVRALRSWTSPQRLGEAWVPPEADPATATRWRRLREEYDDTVAVD